MVLHTGSDKLDLYRKRKTVSCEGSDILKGNLSWFHDPSTGVDKLKIQMYKLPILIVATETKNCKGMIIENNRELLVFSKSSATLNMLLNLKFFIVPFKKTSLFTSNIHISVLFFCCYCQKFSQTWIHPLVTSFMNHYIRANS